MNSHTTSSTSFFYNAIYGISWTTATGGSALHGDELKDELKKLGLRLRPRKIGGAATGKPGHGASADRGDAGELHDALHHPDLAVADDEAPANAPIRNNPKGLRVGYDPYESGVLAKKEWRAKRDLREFSKWIETRKKLNEKPPTED